MTEFLAFLRAADQVELKDLMKLTICESSETGALGPRRLPALWSSVRNLVWPFTKPQSPSDGPAKLERFKAIRFSNSIVRTSDIEPLRVSNGQVQAPLKNLPKGAFIPHGMAKFTA